MHTRPDPVVSILVGLMAVIDGLPDYVEERSLTSDRYCSWHAIVVSVEPLS